MGLKIGRRTVWLSMGFSFITNCVLDVRTRSVCYKNYRFDTSRGGPSGLKLGCHLHGVGGFQVWPLTAKTMTLESSCSRLVIEAASSLA